MREPYFLKILITVPLIIACTLLMHHLPIQPTMGTNATRYVLADLSRTSEMAQMLDARIVWNRNLRLKMPEELKVCAREGLSRLSLSQARLSLLYVHLSPLSPQGGFIGMDNASKWRFQLNTDGHTASSRLGHLLGINSVVLKERSSWIEYYYPALKEGEDHLEFDVHGLAHLLKKLRVRVLETSEESVLSALAIFIYIYVGGHPICSFSM